MFSRRWPWVSCATKTARARGHGDQTLTAVSDLLTVTEAGLPGYEAVLHYGIVAPARTPHEIVEKLNGALNAALPNEDVKRRLAVDGAETLASTPEQYAADIDHEETKWSAVLKKSGAKADLNAPIRDVARQREFASARILNSYTSSALRSANSPMGRSGHCQRSHREGHADGLQIVARRRDSNNSSIEGYSQTLKIIGLKQIHAEAPRHLNPDGVVLPRTP